LSAEFIGWIISKFRTTWKPTVACLDFGPFGAMIYNTGKLKQRGQIMCESNAYFIKDGKEELIMESVNLVKPQGRKTMLKSIFGEELVVEGSLLEMDLSGHRILFEKEMIS
jgi:predicted RNA-binding protein